MARDRDPFTQAYATLRDDLRTAALAPGQALVILDIAKALGMSTTPVREALATLHGEGLIERGPGPGYSVLKMDASAARDRYALQHCYLVFAIDALPPLSPVTGDDQRVVSPVEIFRHLVTSTGNQSLVRAYRRLDNQMSLLQAAESKVLGNDAELGAPMTRALRDGQWPVLRELIDRHFRLRRETAGPIASSLDPTLG